MPYATIREILSEVDAENPPAPGQFPDFDPEDLQAWAYFIYLYLYHSPSDRWGSPQFLPICYKKEENGPLVWVRPGDANTFKNGLFGDYNQIKRLEVINSLLNYIRRLVGEWHYGWDGKSKEKMGFVMNSMATYEGCLARADKARDVAWKKIMQYSGEMLYSRSQLHVGSKTRKWKVQTDTGEAFILPQLAILFYRVNVEWQKVFKHSLEVSGGYRTKSHQLREYRQVRAEGGMAAEHSAHVSGAAIDVVSPEVVYANFSCNDNQGRNILLGYMAWLFRRVARRGVKTFVHVEYAGNVTRQLEETGSAWEWAGMKLLRPIPYTMVESANKALHVSYIWLLRAEKNRKEELPSLVRPYSGDIANPEGTEAKGPRAFDPLLVSFDERSYLADVGSGAKTTLGITPSWMKAFIEHEYPSEGEVIQVQEQIKSIEDAILQEKDSNKKNQLNNELDRLKKKLEELSQRRSDLSLVMDREAALSALDEQSGWM